MRNLVIRIKRIVDEGELVMKRIYVCYSFYNLFLSKCLKTNQVKSKKVLQLINFCKTVKVKKWPKGIFFINV